MDGGVASNTKAFMDSSSSNPLHAWTKELLEALGSCLGLFVVANESLILKKEKKKADEF